MLYHSAGLTLLIHVTGLLGENSNIARKNVKAILLKNVIINSQIGWSVVGYSLLGRPLCCWLSGVHPARILVYNFQVKMDFG